MAGLAYILLPVTGFVAYVGGRTWRARFHGLQAIALGLLWPLALYGGAAVGRAAVGAVAAAGALAWLVLAVGAMVGRDPKLPLLGNALARAAERAPGDV